MRLRPILLAAGGAGAAVAFLLEPRAATQAASRTWPPFVLVAGLLTIGVVAYEDGTFGAAGGLLDRLPGGETALFLTAMALVAVTTALLNLDTSVAFLTPVLIHVTRRRSSREEPFLYGCVFMSNAASLLLPGSNLTNLLVLADEHVSGSLFLARMAVPWLAAVTVTAAVVGTAFRHGKPPPIRIRSRSPRPTSSAWRESPWRSSSSWRCGILPCPWLVSASWLPRFALGKDA